MSALGYRVGLSNGTEQVDPIDLEIEGRIPLWLTGVLYRSGPATFDIPLSSSSEDFHFQHWFDGLTMNHRFEIYNAPDGSKQVSYRSRKAAADLEQRIADEGKLPGGSFGQRPDREGIFKKLATTFRDLRADPRAPNTATSGNVGVTLTPDMPGWPEDAVPADYEDPHYLVAKTDANRLQLIDPVTLEPLRLATYQDLFPSLEGQLAAAHSCRDQETGDYFNFVCKFGGRFPTYKVFRIAKDNTMKVLAEITDAPAAFIHSFAMSGGYVILCIWSSYITLGGLSIVYNRNVAQSIDTKTDPSVPAVFYVIDRHNGGVVAKYKSPPFFAFHQLNAFDEPSTGDLIIDMSVYPDASIIHAFELETMRKEGKGLVGQARRFRLPSPSSADPKVVQNAVVEFSLPADLGIELPTVRPNVFHKPYRFVYGVHKKELDRPAINDSLIKVDMTPAAEHKVWWRPNTNPSEPIFVSRPGSTEEDDGVLLTVALDGTTGKSSVVVVDARDMTVLAEAKMRTHYPFGFHGAFVGSKAGRVADL